MNTLRAHCALVGTCGPESDGQYFSVSSNAATGTSTPTTERRPWFQCTGGTVDRRIVMHPLATYIQPYAWGSPTLLPEILGVTATGGPMAELWVGAHPSLPSRMRAADASGDDMVGLDTVIAADPHRWLGSAVVARFGPRLPFLLKVLAVDAPLSLQAHPNRAQARAGFLRERTLKLSSAESSYTDDNHKPELIVALTPMEALYGFRPIADLQALRTTLGSARFDRVLGDVASAEDLRAAVGGLLRLSAADARELVDELRERAHRLQDQPRLSHWLTELAARYPHDPGVAVSLLLNHVHLEPGEALFVPAGVLHAYLTGVGVEVLAASDNVMRGGLTPKRVDVDGLLDIIDTTPALPTTTTLHDAPTCPDFRLHRLGPVPLRTSGPGLVLCLAGEVGGSKPTLQQGEAAFWGADEQVALVSEGTAFAVTLGP
jgi:mannose-6-phosphate isomerase